MVIKNKSEKLSIEDFKKGECFETSVGAICMKVEFKNGYDEYNAVNLETGMMNYYGVDNHTLTRVKMEGKIV